MYKRMDFKTINRKRKREKKKERKKERKKEKCVNDKTG
jgi:hypothetical protein